MTRDAPADRCTAVVWLDAKPRHLLGGYNGGVQAPLSMRRRRVALPVLFTAHILRAELGLKIFCITTV